MQLTAAFLAAVFLCLPVAPTARLAYPAQRVVTLPETRLTMAEIDPILIHGFLNRAEAEPVLVDVGASGSDHPLWGSLAASSHFVGFDPDGRDMNPDLGEQFLTHKFIDKIVKGNGSPSSVPFYLTALPACSSMLRPNESILQHYLFADLFDVQKETAFHAVTLAEAMDDLGLTHLDWLKLDTQGCDWTILNGLDSDRLDNLLCLEVEPGFEQFYEGEETFVELHDRLTKSGFWLATLNVQAFPRVRGEVIEKTFGHRIQATESVASLIGGSPTAAEALYFRSLDHLRQHADTVQRYAIAWVFAICIGKFGAALDLAADALERFGENDTTKFMHNAAVGTLVALTKGGN